MRLLVLAPQASVAPEDGGGSKRPWQLMTGFERHGIGITMWSIAPPSPSDPFHEHTALARRADLQLPGRPRRGFTDKVRALASPLPEEVWMRPAHAGPWVSDLVNHDLLMFMGPHATQMLPFAMAAGLPIVFDAHDVPARLFARIAPTIPGRVARWRTALDSLKWRRYQRRLVAASTLVAAVSEPDAREFRSLTDTPVVVRPNGVDVRGYRFDDHRHNRNDRLLLTGHFSYLPNVDAARWLTSEMLPRLRATRPAVTVDLVGRHLPPGPWPARVRATPNVPDIQPWFEMADVLVVPLRAGGGTRIKIAEAFAKGLPCVSTSIGCEGLPVEDGVHLLIADTTEQFVAATLRLLDDAELRGRLTTNARRLVEERFDWAAIVADYAADLFAIVGDRAHRPSTEV